MKTVTSSTNCFACEACDELNRQLRKRDGRQAHFGTMFVTVSPAKLAQLKVGHTEERSVVGTCGHRQTIVIGVPAYPFELVARLRKS